MHNYACQTVSRFCMGMGYEALHSTYVSRIDLPAASEDFERGCPES